METRKSTGIPLTSSDLADIAEQVERVEGGLGNPGGLPEGDWRRSIRVQISDDMGWYLGEVRAHEDGWFGFYPEGW